MTNTDQLPESSDNLRLLRDVSVEKGQKQKRIKCNFEGRSKRVNIRMSSGHIAYHMEAQRRQRVLDKKHAALEKLAREKTEIDRLKEEQLRLQRRRSLEQEEMNSRAREHYLKNMGRMGTLQQNGHPQRYVDMIPERQDVVNRDDLRHQARVLRDSCLYMGPVNEYFWA